MSLKIAVGDVTIHRIIEQEQPFFEVHTFFPTLGKERYEENRSWMEPRYVDPTTGKLILCIQSHLVVTPHHKILIDTCVGNHKERPTRAFWHKMDRPDWERGLKATGYGVDDIDFVMCTHMHTDHIGWNTRLDNGRWVPTFPRARYLFGRKELDFWISQPNRAEIGGGSLVDSVIPIVEAKVCDLVDDGHDLGKGLTLALLPGHTPGQLGLDVVRGRDRAYFVGDAIHSPLQVVYPDLSTGFDTDKQQARETRRKFLEACAGDGRWLVPCHFRGAVAHRIRRAGGGFALG
jgi:glyoxylase-like metal-dependent hydrolase (beta-lactamase superfamily II)